MRLKKEYIALAVIILGLLFYIFFKNTDRTHYVLPALGKIEKSDITKMVISRASGDLTLQRENDRWLIEPEGYPADEKQIDKMLDAVSNFTLTSLVSESGIFTPYDLTDDKKIGIEIFTGDRPSRKFDIGKTASTYRHTFVRLDQDENVYQARENLRQPFDVEMNRLRDKNVSVFEKEFVSAVSIRDSSGTIEVAKAAPPPVPMPGDTMASQVPAPGPLWQTADSRAADDKVMDGIINTLSSLRCDSYLEGKTKEDMGSPIFSITVEGEKPVTLDIFAKQADNKYPAVSSQNDYPFLLSEWTVKRFMKKPAEILKKEKEGE